MLVNSETIGTLPAFSNPTVIAPTRQDFGGSPEETPSLRRPTDGPEAISGDSFPISHSSFSHTPLIWDALADRYQEDGEEKNKQTERDRNLFFKKRERTTAINNHELVNREKGVQQNLSKIFFPSPSVLLSPQQALAKALLQNVSQIKLQFEDESFLPRAPHLE